MTIVTTMRRSLRACPSRRLTFVDGSHSRRRMERDSGQPSLLYVWPRERRVSCGLPLLLCVRFVCLGCGCVRAGRGATYFFVREFLFSERARSCRDGSCCARAILVIIISSKIELRVPPKTLTGSRVSRRRISRASSSTSYRITSLSSSRRVRTPLPSHQSPHPMGACGLRMTQCGFGWCFVQKASGSLGACFSCSSFGHQLSKAGSETHCGCAEQYGRAPGLARYCW